VLSFKGFDFLDFMRPWIMGAISFVSEIMGLVVAGAKIPIFSAM